MSDTTGDAILTDPTIDVPADKAPGKDTDAPTADVKPKRVRDETTRAGRAAKARANAAERKANDKPPRAGSAAARKSPLVSRVDGALQGVGLSVTVAGGILNSQPVIADGQVIMQHAPSVAAALDKVAAGDPRVKEALEKLLTVGAYGGLFAAVLPLAIGIMANHGAVPPGLAGMMGAQGVTPPAGQSAPGPTTLDDEAFGGAAG